MKIAINYLIRIVLIFGFFFTANSQTLITHDFNNGNFGPYEINKADQVSRVSITNKAVETHWQQKLYNGSNSGRKAQFQATNNITFTQHIWMGLKLKIHSDYMKDNTNTNAGLMQIWGFNEATGSANHMCMLKFDGRNGGALVWQHRYNSVADKTHYLVEPNFPRDEFVDVIVHVQLKTRTTGIVQVWVNGELKINKKNQAIGWGDMNENGMINDTFALGPSIGQYNFFADANFDDAYDGDDHYFDGHLNGETRTVTYDNVSLYNGVDGYDLVDPNDSVSPPSNNIALNGTASQSSTGYSGTASRAIDGNTNGAYSQTSVTHTKSELNAWWQVDLGSNYSIDDIKVFNRTDTCCKARLTNFTVSVINSNGATTFSQSYTSYPNPSRVVNANGAIGNTVRIQLNDTNPLSLAEVEVYGSASSSVFPDPNKTYYIDAPRHNLRLAATGGSEDAYSTSTNTTGANVEWKFVDKGNGYWHIQRAAGGATPRLRSDNSTNADMQGTGWNGTYTYYGFSEGAINNTYFLTLPDGPVNYRRLQIDNTGRVRMVEDTRNGTWESFLITEASSSKRVDNTANDNLEDFNIYPNPVINTLNIKFNDNYNNETSIVLYAMNGQKVMEAKPSTEVKLDLSTLNAGVYILKVNNKSKTSIKKIVKL